MIELAVLISLAFWSAPTIRRLEDSVAFQAYENAEPRQRFGVDAIAIDPTDASLALTSSISGEIALWDLSTLSAYWRRKVGDWPTALAFSHTGRLALAGGRAKVYLLDLADGKILREYEPLDADGQHFEAPDQLLFNKDDSEVIAGYASRVFRFDTATGRLIHRYGDHIFDSFFMVKDVELSLDERVLYVLDERSLRAFSVTSHEQVLGFYLAEVANLPRIVADGIPTRMRLTTDGAYTVLAHGSFVYVIDNAARRLVRKTFAAAQSINSVAFTADQCCFVTASADGTSRLYEIATGLELSRLDDTGPASGRKWFMSVAVPRVDGPIITGDAKGEVRLWHP